MEEDDTSVPMELEESIPAQLLVRDLEGLTNVEATPATPPKLEQTQEASTRDLSEKPTNGQGTIILDDDEDAVAPAPDGNAASDKQVIDLVTTSKATRCLNPHCDKVCKEFIEAPECCFSYFRVKRSLNCKEDVCLFCYNKAIEDNDILVHSLLSGRELFKVDFPVLNETFQIDDSDEEDQPTEEVEFITERAYKCIIDNLEDVLTKAVDEHITSDRMEMEQKYLKERFKTFEGTCSGLDKQISGVKKMFDKIGFELYTELKPEIKDLMGITILDDFSLSPLLQVRAENVQTYQKSSVPRKVNKIVQKPAAPVINSPPIVYQSKIDQPRDVVDKPAPKIDEIYYISRENNSQGSWIKARLQNIVLPNTSFQGTVISESRFVFIELKQQKERVLTGKFVAYPQPPDGRLKNGTRVISELRDQAPDAKPRSATGDPFYAGVVAESPVESNKFRYLIFFDIGYAQYVPQEKIRLVLDASKQVWTDIASEDTQYFIKKYLESADRPMVKLLPNQTVKVEYKGKWWLCTIKAVDCSLIQVYFNQLYRWEWIYRGSTRLNPMFREEQAANRHSAPGTRPLRKPNESSSVVQYTRNDDFVADDLKEKENTVPTTARAVARKSTTTRNPINQPPPKCIPFLPTSNNTGVFTGPTSKIMYFTPRDQGATKVEYKPHNCGPQCKSFLTHNFQRLKGHNPLSKPLLCGWTRMTSRDRGRRETIYKAPCGRTIRNISEIHYYLVMTESDMTVDLFDFNPMVRCLAEFSVDCAPDPKDLSGGKEQVPIPVINGFNSEALDFSDYSTVRCPANGVELNLDPGFLCGCDCEDDCVDKTKCACWKLTMQGLKYMGKNVDPNTVGYIYRRLQEQVITGIYECNSRCKCSKTCLNRVVQNPLSLKLQVFKTHNRGWGIRCLNDIPQGVFVCIYAGTLLSEAAANESGKTNGDEYFAELDYIETVEKYKEDYEEDVIEDEEFGEERVEKESAEDDKVENDRRPFNIRRKINNYLEDNDFTVNSNYKSGKTSHMDGIRSRLRDRRRREDEEKDEEASNPEPEDKPDIKNLKESMVDKMDTVTISDDEDDGREILSFNPKAKDVDEKPPKYTSVREMFGPEEMDNIYIMDAKETGNIGRFLNHSCCPNVFVQNVFVDTHDVRFPWVAFFSSQFIRAGSELTWNYNYDIGSVPGRILYCHCNSLECKGRLL